MTTSSSYNRNNCIEAIRGVACIFVVFCHFHLQDPLGLYVISIARFAVPFFMMLSGYFACKSNQADNISYAKRKLSQTIKLTLIGTLICIIANSLVCLILGEPIFKWFLDVLSLKTLLKFLIFNRAYWLSSVMYYPFMMIYVYIAYILVNKLSLLNISYISIPILLLVNIIVSKTTENWYYVGNFFFTGFPFFMLGNCLRKNNKVSAWGNKSIIFIFIGLIMTLIECYFCNYCYLFVGTVFLSIGLLLFGLSHSNLSIPVFLSKFGTKCSMFVFLLHCPIGYIIQALLNSFKIQIDSYLPFIVLIVTVAISILIVKTKRINTKVSP